MDRALKFLLSWGLLLVSLVAFGPLSAFYFAFCWLVSGFIDRKVLRVEREETLARAGVPADEIDSRLLARDRLVAIARSLFAVGAAALFHSYA